MILFCMTYFKIENIMSGDFLNSLVNNQNNVDSDDE